MVTFTCIQFKLCYTLYTLHRLKLAPFDSKQSDQENLSLFKILKIKNLCGMHASKNPYWRKLKFITPKKATCRSAVACLLLPRSPEGSLNSFPTS